MSLQTKIALSGVVAFVVLLALGLLMAVSNAPTLGLILINLGMLSLMVATVFGIIALVKRLRRERRDSYYPQDQPRRPE